MVSLVLYARCVVFEGYLGGSTCMNDIQAYVLFVWVCSGVNVCEECMCE